jgi:hypothetical protein
MLPESRPFVYGNVTTSRCARLFSPSTGGPTHG